VLEKEIADSTICGVFEQYRVWEEAKSSLEKDKYLSVFPVFRENHEEKVGVQGLQFPEVGLKKLTSVEDAFSQRA